MQMTTLLSTTTTGMEITSVRMITTVKVLTTVGPHSPFQITQILQTHGHLTVVIMPPGDIIIGDSHTVPGAGDSLVGIPGDILMVAGTMAGIMAGAGTMAGMIHGVQITAGDTMVGIIRGTTLGTILGTTHTTTDGLEHL